MKFNRTIVLALMALPFTTDAQEGYKIVDTQQSKLFDNNKEIVAPAPKDAFYGQDGQHKGNQPSYTDNGDGTITDHITGLIWQKEYKVMSYPEAVKALESFELAGNREWRLPTIQEAYSLILFNGVDASSKQMRETPAGVTAFLDTAYFTFKYAANGTRPIDSQLLSSTMYVGANQGRETFFGVNFADGRIKSYPLKMKGEDKDYMVRFVRGKGYGKNDFIDNQDGTISDRASGLMWQKSDSQKGMNWEKALAYAQEMNAANYLGHSDWRVPNAKELHSIVDYTRCPKTTKSAAIHPIFEISSIKDESNKSNYPFFWSSTTHEGSGKKSGHAAVYICFGEGLGNMPPKGGGKSMGGERPQRGGQASPGQGRGGAGQSQRGGAGRGAAGGQTQAVASWIDVHGAGAQRSDPKSGNTSKFADGRGPQGDAVRIENYVRLVRGN